MIAVIVNAIAVLVGATIGLLLKKGIPERLTDALMKGLGLCTLYIAWSGSLVGTNTLVLILSIAIGAAVGEGLDLDRRVNEGVRKIEGRFQKEGGTSLAEGMITSTMLFCVGAMSIVGSLQAGISGDYEMLFTKSVLDFISSMVFASTLGAGVLLSIICILVYQGGLVLLAEFVAPFLSTGVVAELTCVGSVLLFGLGLNMIGVSKFKVINYLPALIFPLILTPLLANIL